MYIIIPKHLTNYTRKNEMYKRYYLSYINLRLHMGAYIDLKTTEPIGTKFLTHFP